MIALAQLMRDHQADLIQHYQAQMQARHYTAMQAIIDCHTAACGERQYQCAPCETQQTFYQACGHRSCPRCQHQSNNQWLERQRQKLLPCDYFMVTFTLPYQLRSFVWHHQKLAYQAIFEAAVKTLALFAKNDKKLGVDLGITGILHTHSRKLNFHPHGHFIVPGGGLNKKHRFWKQKAGHYLFNGKALAKVFRAKFIAAIEQRGIHLPAKLPNNWVAHCEHVGQGETALVYLARYLYRGVISEKNIVEHAQGKVTFRYQESQSTNWKTRTESVLTFLWLVLQHVLPKGFRRVRDYGFLHGNAKRKLKCLQLMLRTRLSIPKKKDPKIHPCPCCGEAMQLVNIVRKITRHLCLASP